MIDFLLKSTITMGILLVLYYLLLEKEKMHRFNRFYLLGAVGASLAIPFISIPVYVETVAHATSLKIAHGGTAIETQIPEPDYLPYVVGTVYALVTLAYVMKFIITLIYFRKKIKGNIIINYRTGKLVLLEEKALPHTFLNYIFINKQEYESGKIEEELYTHELAHVTQKHTLDILFIEVLKTIFWFNPLLYLYKRAIQLNHEFLADQKVIETKADTSQYQKLLLDRASAGETFYLASSLNFSITKKRFTMMTRSTSKTKKAILQAVILPFLCGLTILLCIETVAQETSITVDYTKVGKIIVLTPTSKEIDSLREVDPAMYKDEPNTRIMRTDYTVTEKGKQKVVTTYDKQSDYKAELSEKTMNSIGNIDPEKIKSINVNSVSEAEMDSLKAAEPEYYRNAKAADYKRITMVYLDNEDKQVKKTYYESNAPLNFKAIDREQDKQPQFSEGNFEAYVHKYFKVPNIKENLDVKVYVSFVIETNGSLSEIKILRDPGHGIGEEIKRIVEKSPKWHPGTVDGSPTRMAYTLPIRISIKN